MTHASNELVAAMRGECPASKPEVFDMSALDSACGGPKHDPGLSGSGNRNISWSSIGWAADRECPPDTIAGDVDCPACLALMDSARGEQRTADLLVHADAQMEKGLLPVEPGSQLEGERQRSTATQKEPNEIAH